MLYIHNTIAATKQSSDKNKFQQAQSSYHWNRWWATTVALVKNQPIPLNSGCNMNRKVVYAAAENSTVCCTEEKRSEVGWYLAPSCGTTRRAMCGYFANISTQTRAAEKCIKRGENFTKTWCGYHSDFDIFGNSFGRLKNNRVFSPKCFHCRDFPSTRDVVRLLKFRFLALGNSPWNLKVPILD